MNASRSAVLQEIGSHTLAHARKADRSATAVIELFDSDGGHLFEIEELRQGKMAKYRHRTFEMFDFCEEAASALYSRSARYQVDSDDPKSWTFQRLVASRSGEIVHLKFKPKDCLDSKFSIELRSDFWHLADSLVNDSRILLDFTGLVGFGPECIDELKRFNSKLQSKGSRIVLCNLEPTVRASFFPHRIGDDRTSSVVS